MKKLLFLTIFVFTMAFLIACGTDTNSTVHNPIFPEECTCGRMTATVFYQDFESALLESTNIVVAQLVERRPFGHSREELEFIVIDQLYGRTSDRIFIYLSHNVYISVSGGDHDIPAFRETDVEFEKGIDYLLTLRMIDSVVSNFNDYAYFLMNSALVVNLDTPIESTMYSQPLELHATELDFADLTLTADNIIEFVVDLVDDYGTPAHDYRNIRSNKLDDVVNYSPIIVEIEINEFIDSSHSCFRAADWFRVTVVDSLRGGFEIGYYFKTIFFMGTVTTGERYIMTLREGTFYPHSGTGLEMHMPNSRNGIIDVSYFDEILAIINDDRNCENCVEYPIDYDDTDEEILSGEDSHPFAIALSELLKNTTGNLTANLVVLDGDDSKGMLVAGFEDDYVSDEVLWALLFYLYNENLSYKNVDFIAGLTAVDGRLISLRSNTDYWSFSFFELNDGQLLEVPILIAQERSIIDEVTNQPQTSIFILVENNWIADEWLAVSGAQYNELLKRFDLWESL